MMASPVGAYDSSNTVPDEREPPAKSPKHRHVRAVVDERCDDQRPCSNCTRAGEQCNEAVPASYSRPFFAPAMTVSSPHMPLAWLGDIASLEERISRLEENNTQSTVNGNLRGPQLGQSTQTAPFEEQVPRRFSIVSRTDPEGSLTRSSPAIGLLATFARAEGENTLPLNSHEHSAIKGPQNDAAETLDQESEDTLFEIYQNIVHCRYPFLHLINLRDPTKRPTGYWVGFFTNLISSIGLLLERSNQFDTSQHNHQKFYRIAVTRYLSHVFAQPDRLLHIQAYLLLAMHAIYSPSTERIISIVSATVRYCVMAQLHLADAEPAPVGVAAKIEIQMRRRVFWSAYALDRAVGTAFDLPFSIPDYQITVKLYANLNDSELDERIAESDQDISVSRPRLTSISFALHLVYCRQIQSEILNTTLHRDFGMQFDGLSDWRLRVLAKLDRWKSLCHRYSDPRSETYNSGERLHMIYNYSLALLYQPTKATVTGPAGDWTVKSCVQACLYFRKFQREAPTSELWLGLVVQFKCGVALLYCFFATPPHLRSEAYELPEATEAVRACSIVLSVLAERWPQSKCVRDAFDILAREIPLYEPPRSTQSANTPRRMRRESAEALLSLIGQLEIIIVHRNTLRMLKEMALEEFPRSFENGQNGHMLPRNATEGDNQLDDGDSPTWRTSLTGDMFQPVTPYFFRPNLSGLDPDGFDYMAIGFPEDFDPQISF